MTSISGLVWSFPKAFSAQIAGYNGPTFPVFRVWRASVAQWHSENFGLPLPSSIKCVGHAICANFMYAVESPAAYSASYICTAAGTKFPSILQDHWHYMQLTPRLPSSSFYNRDNLCRCRWTNFKMLHKLVRMNLDESSLVLKRGKKHDQGKPK